MIPRAARPASAVRPLPPPASITLVDGDGPHRTLVLTGEWDMANAQQLEDAVAEALPADGPAPQLTVDLCAVTFLDSMVLNRLVQVEQRVATLAGTLAVRCSPGVVQRTLEITGMAEQLGVEVLPDAARKDDRSSAA